MNVGIVAPVEYLKFCNTNLHLCYSEFLSEPEYLSFYRAKTSLKKNTVILDYSPSLPRKRVNLNSLVAGIRVLKPQIVVLPSIDYSWIRTANLSNEFAEEYDDILPKTIGMLQGIDLDSLAKCYFALKECSDIIGLGSPLESIARREEIIRDLKITKPIIYIEVFQNPYEEVPPDNCMGMITSYPFRLAQALRTMAEFKPNPPALNFLAPKGKLLDDLVVKNIRDYMEVVQEGLRV